MSVGQTFPEQYDKLFEEKQSELSTLFQDFETPTLESYASQPEYFRMRAEFKIWHEGDRSFYAMFNPEDPRTPVEITHFPIGGKLINELMPKLLEKVHQHPELRNRLFQIEFLTTLKNEALVTMIYHRKLEDAWIELAKPLEQEFNIKLIGRSRKQRIVLSEDFVEESFTVEGQAFHYRQYENGFTQPNSNMCETMLNWAVKNSKRENNEDLLELYCGNGNFTLPLSKNFKQTLATEISKTSVKAAKENIELNQSKHVNIEKMSAEDFSMAWLKKDVQSKRYQRFEIEKYNFNSVFVDPPRAGLDEDTVELVRHFDQIIYISCNPNTLVENINALYDTHKIEKFALFDQFPYTHHMEAGVVLTKR